MLTAKLLMLLTASIALTVAAPAVAAVDVTGVTTTTLTLLGPGTTINFNGQQDGTVIAGVSSSLFLQLTSQGLGTASFHYVLTDNNSSVHTRLSIFGFDTNPTLTSATVDNLLVNPLFNSVNYTLSPTKDISISNGMSVDICFLDKAAGKSCSGGGSGGITTNSSAAGDFTLNYGTTSPTLSLSNFVVRYQDFPPSGSGVGIPVPGGVPEPATWAMMLLGFGAMGVSLRRSRRRHGRILPTA